MPEIRGLTVLGVLMPAVNLNLLSLYVDISGSKGDT